MLTEKEINKIEERFNSAVAVLGNKKKEVEEFIGGCNEQEAVCMKFLYGYMPVSDMADYDGSLFLKFVRHALKVKEIMPWGREMEWDIFLNYVLQYRINNENIEFFSGIFYEELAERIKGLSMHDAVLEVNYWCFEKATYQTTDDRTASPLTVCKNAYGRCGEESTLCVAALRSVGIPARQCYTPRWAHCDDNHAWVEVWVDGTWHFLGACEPEGRLDTGWFRLPASKAMLIHNRVLSDLVRDELITKQNEKMTEINVLGHYADTKEIAVQIVDEDKNPLPGITVGFEVVNYAEFFPLAALTTDENGEVSFITGLGDLVITAWSKEACVSEKMDVRVEDRLVLTLPKEPVFKAEWDEYTLVPPAGGITEEKPLKNPEYWKGKNEAALAKRKEYEAGFFTEEEAEKFAARLNGCPEGAEDILVQARGNRSEVAGFLEDAATAGYMKEKLMLLKTLRKKDLTDCTKEVLEDHLMQAVPHKDQAAEEVFSKYVLCPRIWLEMITPYRRAILDALTEEQKALFKKDKKALYEWLKAEVSIYNDSEYSNLTTSPAGALKVKQANEISWKILLTAVLRTLGIPAKIDKADGRAAYFEDGCWHYFVKEQKQHTAEDGRLIIRKEEGAVLAYYKNYTVSCFHEGRYVSLNLEDIPWQQDRAEYKLLPGRYRIVTAERQPDGVNLVRVYYTAVEAGKTSEVLAVLCKGDKQAKSVDIPDGTVQIKEQKCKLSGLLCEPSNIAAWIQTSAEPTEHLLNEIIESKEQYVERKPNVVLFVRNKEELKDVTLQKALKAVPHITVAQDPDFEKLESVFEGFGITDRQLPLALIVNDKKQACHAWSGYNVGIGEMLIKNL